MDENRTVDTPQEDSIVDDVIFGSRDASELTEESPFTQPEETAITETPDRPRDSLGRFATPDIPEEQPEAPQSQEPPLDNEQVRYQYWQSEADKRGNELEQMKQTNQMLQGQVNTLIQQPATPQQGIPQEEESFEFPPPPEKPQKPVRYNRVEAYEDPNSESGIYLDAVEEWRDNMDEYGNLRSEYDREMAIFERGQLTEERNREREALQQYARQQEQVDDIRQHVRKQYNADDAAIDEFIQVMSSPDSLTVDNLWKLYSLDRGTGTNAPKPSPAFQQTRRAQQIPSPMGVVSGVNRQTDKTAEDRIMDELIGDFDKQNPW